MEQFTAWLANNVWVSLGLAWIIIIIALTEFTKQVARLVLGEGDPKIANILRLTPQLLGAITGAFIAPAIADTTPFASIGWMEGILFGFVAGLGAIGFYELARETRPLRMAKVFVRAAFSFVVETVFRRKLTEEETAELDRTQKRPPVDP